MLLKRAAMFRLVNPVGDAPLLCEPFCADVAFGAGAGVAGLAPFCRPTPQSRGRSSYSPLYTSMPIPR
jgi:hypothetical protein